MKKGLRTGLIGAAALGAVLAALAFALPASAYKERIAEGVERATGRKLAIDGPMRFTLLPSLGIRAERVSLANPPDFRGGPFATARELEIGVRLLPLLGGRIEMTEIVLDHPVVHLEVDAAGRSNWLFRRAAKPGTHGGGTSPTAHFSGIRIAGGRIVYDNARTRTSRIVEDLDAAVDITDLDRPARAFGHLALSGKRTRFDVTVTTPRAVLNDAAVGVDLALDNDLAKARLAGQIDRAGTFAGHAKIDAPSLHNAAAAFGARLPGGRFLLDGALEARDDGARLHDLKLTLDGMSASGAIALQHQVLTADLAIDRLNLDAHSAPATGPAHTSGEEEWNRAPLVLASLRDVTLHAHIEAGAFSYGKIKAGKTSIRVDADRDIVMTDLRQQMYGGTASVGITADLRSAMPVWSVNGDFENVALGPFLTDTIGVTQIEGTGTIKLDVTSQGANTEAIMRALAGKGAFAFHDGRIKGVDLGRVARTVQAFLGAATAKGTFTDYKSMTASFAAKDGVLTSKDFQLDGPLIRASGAGDVDVGRRTIDLRIVPKTTATLGKIRLVDIGVPFRIKGPWRHVRYMPDIGGIVGGILNAPLDRLLGDPKTKHKTVGDALKNMLGIH